MKRPSLPKKTAAQLRKVVLTVNFFQQLIISWKHRSGNLWCFFCGSTTFPPRFFVALFHDFKPSLAWKWYPWHHRWWRPLGNRRWGVAPLRPSIFTPLEAVEGCMAAMNVLAGFLWWFLCCGVIFKKGRALGQETSREAKQICYGVLMIQNSGDEEFRYEDSKIWRQGDSSWLSWTFDGSNLARCSSENPTLSRVNQRGFVLLDDSETDMVLTSQIEPLNVFLPMHWQLAASIFFAIKSLFCKRKFQVPNQERNISITQTYCCIHHISPYTIVVSRNLISHWNLPSTISGLFTCRYHGLKVPPLWVGESEKDPLSCSGPHHFLALN